MNKMLVAKVVLDKAASPTCPSEDRRISLLLYDTSNDKRDVAISDVLADEGLAKYSEK